MKYLHILTVSILIALSSSVLAGDLNKEINQTYLRLQITECGSTVAAVGENIKELSGSSAQFQMRIENIGNTSNTFSIHADNFSSAGENPDGSSMENNIDFTQEILDLNLNAISGEITLAPGEVFEFIVKVSMPLNNQYDRWNCTEIKSINSSCPENEGRAVVFTYIPVPEGVIIGCIDKNAPIYQTNPYTSNKS